MKDPVELPYGLTMSALRKDTGPIDELRRPIYDCSRTHNIAFKVVGCCVMTRTNFDLNNFIDLVESFFGAQYSLCEHIEYTVYMCKAYISKFI